MQEKRIELDRQDALQIWASLAEEGKAPSELNFAAQVLPAYSVGINSWLERLTSTYLEILSRKHSHFKVVIAPYGGGKTHFLMAFGNRALEEDFAVSYIACAPGVDFDNAIELYKAFMRSIQLPAFGEKCSPGISELLRQIVERKMSQIRHAKAPDPDAAFEQWLIYLLNKEHQESSFGRVVAEALRMMKDPQRAVAGNAAFRWLRGEIDTLDKQEMAALHLARIPQKARNEFGRNMLLSVLGFIPEAGVNGTVILFDEVETMFNAKGKALQKVLSAMRLLLDRPSGVPGGLPLFCLFSAVPDILEQLPKYKALEQRLAVKGASFEEGANFSPQLHLENVHSQEELLRAIGERLIELGGIATAYEFDHSIQKENVRTLAAVASEMNLEIDARRLFVKACVNILDIQATQSEYLISEEELSDRYRGFFENVKKHEETESEP